MKNRHPSGRPMQKNDARGWGDGVRYGIGYRLPRIRKANGDDGEMTHAIGFASGFRAEMPDHDEWLVDPGARRR